MGHPTMDPAPDHAQTGHCSSWRAELWIAKLPPSYVKVPTLNATLSSMAKTSRLKLHFDKGYPWHCVLAHENMASTPPDRAAAPTVLTNMMFADKLLERIVNVYKKGSNGG